MPQSTDVLDFEPEEEEGLKEGNENEEAEMEIKEGETGGEKPDWLNNVASPSRVPEKEAEDDEVIMLGDSDDEDDDDDVIVGNISKEDNLVKEDEENEDLDELGDEIDAACPGGESNKERSPHKRASSPLKKKTLEGDRSRSSSIEIICDTTSKDRSGSTKRKKKPGNDLKSGRQLREETQRLWTGSGCQADDPVAKYFSKEARDKGGFKVVVKNFAKDLTKSEFYSIFVRRGEVVYCEMKKDIGYVTFRTRVAAANAVKTLNGSKTDAAEGQTLSVREIGSPPTRRASPERRPYDARDRLSSSRWGPDPVADARNKLSRPRDDRNNLFSKMASGGGGGFNDGRGRRHSGGSAFPPLPVPPPRGHMMGRGDERNRGGDFGNRHHGHHDGGFVRRDGRENLGAFGNGGILGEKPVEYFSDFGGSYQGQGNRRGEMMNRGGRRTDHLEREFMGGRGGGRDDRYGGSGNSMGGGMGGPKGGMGMGGLEGGQRMGPFIHAPMGG